MTETSEGGTGGVRASAGAGPAAPWERPEPGGAEASAGQSRAGAEGRQPGGQPHERHWQRLNPLMLAVHPLRQLIGFLPPVLVFLLVGAQDMHSRFYGLLAGVGLVVGFGLLRWLTTRYRITGERVELRSGLLFRTARSTPLDRIRSVDLTAGPIHQLFGLSVVKIGTGQRTDGVESRELSLDAVAATEADRLRTRLLERARQTHSAIPASVTPGSADAAPTADAAGTGAAGPQAVASEGEVLGRLDWAWLRFAPLTVSSLVAVGAVAGTFAQFVGDLGVRPGDVSKLGGVGTELATAPLWLGISLFALVVLMVAVLGSVLIFVETWWGFRLLREPGGTLRIRHGLLTTRSVSLEERRLRGVEVHEPLLLRLGRGARVTALATGLGGRRGHSRGSLLPPAPLEDAHHVAGLTLEEHPSPTRSGLRAHPRAALRRRLVRAVLPVLVVAAALWLAPLPSWSGWVALAALPVTVLLGVDTYRNLGHGLTGHYLLARSGVGVRRTVALQRSGVIGWTVSQTWFQRRSGLVTVAATTAAGHGSYRVIDVRTAEGLALAEEAVPGLLTPFLQGDDARPTQAPTSRTASE